MATELLNLSCAIDTSIPLMSTAIYQNSKKLDESIFLPTVLPGESIENFLSRIYHCKSVYNMDCSIYCQLVSYVLDGTWPGYLSNNTKGLEIPLYIAFGIGDTLLNMMKSKKMFYLTVAKKKAQKILREMETIAKGQWLYKIDEDNYLGLWSDGPKLLSLEKWSHLLYNELGKIQVKWLPFNATFTEGLNSSRNGIISCYYKMGKLQKFRLFSEPGKYLTEIKLSDKEIFEIINNSDDKNSKNDKKYKLDKNSKNDNFPSSYSLTTHKYQSSDNTFSNRLFLDIPFSNSLISNSLFSRNSFSDSSFPNRSFPNRSFSDRLFPDRLFPITLVSNHLFFDDDFLSATPNRKCPLDEHMDRSFQLLRSNITLTNKVIKYYLRRKLAH